MNEIQKQIVAIYEKEKGRIALQATLAHIESVTWTMAKEQLTSNTSAFCRMPEWMQKAMRMLPVGALQLSCGGGAWVTVPAQSEEDFTGEGIDPTFRLNPDYVFEEDTRATTSGFEDAEVIIVGDNTIWYEFSGRGHQSPLGCAFQHPEFICYVYEDRSSGYENKAFILSDKPRIISPDGTTAYTPTHVRFKKGN